MALQNSAKVVWTGDDLNFKGSVGSGYEFDVSAGANRIGGGPMEFLLAGVCGCTAVDVVLILQKQRQQISGVTVEASGLRAPDSPNVYTEVELTYVVSGRGVSPQSVARAIELSEEKYCSASVMFRRSGVHITSTYRIEEDEQEAV
jgi:putative redox protein